MRCFVISTWSRIADTLKSSTSGGDVSLYLVISYRLKQVQTGDVSICIALSNRQAKRVDQIVGIAD